MKHRVATIIALLYCLGTLGGSYLPLAFPGLRGPDLLGLPLFVATPLALIAAIVYAVAARTASRRERMLPLVLILAAVVLWFPVIRLGHWTREALFRRNLPVYEAALTPILQGPAPRSVVVPLDSLPGYAGLCCGRASARIEADGRLTASFAVHRNLRMVYSPAALDTGEVSAPTRGRRVQFAPNWYEEWH